MPSASFLNVIRVDILTASCLNTVQNDFSASYPVNTIQRNVAIHISPPMSIFLALNLVFRRLDAMPDIPSLIHQPSDSDTAAVAMATAGSIVGK